MKETPYVTQSASINQDVQKKKDVLEQINQNRPTRNVLLFLAWWFWLICSKMLLFFPPKALISEHHRLWLIQIEYLFSLNNSKIIIRGGRTVKDLHGRGGHLEVQAVEGRGQVARHQVKEVAGHDEDLQAGRAVEHDVREAGVRQLIVVEIHWPGGEVVSGLLDMDSHTAAHHIHTHIAWTRTH